MLIWKWEITVFYYFYVGAIKLHTPLLMPRNKKLYEHNEASYFMDHSGMLVMLPYDLRVSSIFSAGKAGFEECCGVCQYLWFTGYEFGLCLYFLKLLKQSIFQCLLCFSQCSENQSSWFSQLELLKEIIYLFIYFTIGENNAVLSMRQMSLLLSFFFLHMYETKDFSYDQ